MAGRTLAMPLPASRWFSPEEFRCRDGTPYPEAWLDRWRELSILCDAIRDLWGGPLVVLSGYRTAAYNDKLIASGHHPSSSSQHVQGRAADLAPRFKLNITDPVLDMHGAVERQHSKGLLPVLGGLGLYEKWIHVDVLKAPDGHLRRWDDRKRLHSTS